jgi:DNA repair photolyase
VENFDRVRAKKDALRIIRDELRRKVKTGVIGTGAMSDPYNPFEKELLLTRHALELINAFTFGVAIATKSDLITRDIDILSDIKQHSPVIVKMTVTTYDDDLCRKIEPNVAESGKRFSAMKDLSDHGIFTGILLMPVLPFLEDNEENILNIVRLARKNGARFIYPAFGVTLRQNQRHHYYKKLDELFPGLKDKYIKKYGYAYSCTSPKVKALWTVFKAECEKLGVLYKMQDIIRAYTMGYGDRQLSFFK